MYLPNEILEFHMPRWHELPDLELYMDQVVSVVERSLEPLKSGEESKPITPTMINNYVKQHLVAAPVNKKYGRSQLSSLMMIGILKRFMSLSEIAESIALLRTGRSEQEVYDLFCAAIEEELHAVSGANAAHDISTDPSDLRALYAMARAYSNLVFSRIILTEAFAESHTAETESEPKPKKEKKEKKAKKKDETIAPANEE